ncbi:TetR/AcrR family transcriptional regulator [Microbacterium hominis]|uniref:TetR/AcrR family transcriptional regulator n=1 Tax=Microbacterium hominis TaxID=162426 RepID=A0A134DHD1_9MICO|nr:MULTISPECIES: TetR/AcrR family transcriptional regulator [Microbacterium]AUG28316.1 TetR/AcrR family transcriptional regulator [Microbacterium hominis]KXC05954.1 TetR family transcriptional regulator [Microbacterium hominis]QRY39815.1 TetR/AcrR family transcriptional regulator [Microbacterium hominis]
MSSDQRRRLSREDRRAQLIASGVAFLVSQPLDDLTIEALAAREDVSRALVFHYFGSRQGLHTAVVTTARDALIAASAPREELPPRERLDDTVARIVAFVRAHTGTFYSLVRGVASGDPVVRELVDEARDENARRILDVFRELGHADSATLRVAARAWVAFAEDVLIELAIASDRPAEEITGLLTRSALAVAASVDG